MYKRQALFRKFQGIQRSTTETLGQSVCEPHTFTDNGLLCTDIDYMDVFIRLNSAGRNLGPIGVTTEGGVDGRWRVNNPRRPYATDILGSGFSETTFRSVVPSGYIHRIDFTGNIAGTVTLQAPQLRHGQSTVFRTWYSCLLYTSPSPRD